MKFWGKILMCVAGSAIATVIIYLAVVGVTFLINGAPAKKPAVVYLWVMKS